MRTEYEDKWRKQEAQINLLNGALDDSKKQNRVSGANALLEAKIREQAALHAEVIQQLQPNLPH